MTQSCFEERCNDKASNIKNHHAKVQERPHSKKATQKSQPLVTSTSGLHWTQEVVLKTFKGQIGLQ